jgi:hypothetical protein
LSLAYDEELVYVGLVPRKSVILPEEAMAEQVDFPLN